MTENFGKGYQEGWEQISKRLQPEVKAKIQKILHVYTDVQLNKYRFGRLEMTVSKAVEIECLFKKYGVKNCWNIPGKVYSKKDLTEDSTL